MTTTAPKTLIEAIQYFSDNSRCVEFLSNLRWANGVECVHCGSKHVKGLAAGPNFKCYDCKKKFSVKQGTIFEKSPLSLTKWLTALWLITNAKNGISSYEIHRSVGVTQKTAWFMLHRIREAMREDSFVKFTGTVETDETFVGGKPSNRHFSERQESKQGQKSHRTIVHGMLERGGDVRASVVDDQKAKTLLPRLRENVAPGATIYTDTLRSYLGLSKDYNHGIVDHENNEYVIERENEKIHTNTIEGYWGLLKRCYKGTYIHIAPFHLDRYLDEQAARYNMRKGTDGSRFVAIARQTNGRRLTWNELTGKL